jgi:hypothetical protein
MNMDHPCPLIAAAQGVSRGCGSHKLTFGGLKAEIVGSNQNLGTEGNAVFVCETGVRDGCWRGSMSHLQS